jgi:hypothetical protein
VVRILYAEAARKRPGREYAWWALITLIVQQATNVAYRGQDDGEKIAHDADPLLGRQA